MIRGKWFIRLVKTASLSFLILLLLSDCATYWNQRRKDAEDIVTIGAETPMYGISFKFAPINAGFLFQGGETETGKKDKGKGIGLRGGTIGIYKSQQLTFGLSGGELFHHGEAEVDDAGKVVLENKVPKVADKRDNIKSHSLKYIDILNNPVKERKKRKKETALRTIINDMTSQNAEIDPAVLAYLPKENPKPKGYPNSYLYQFEFVIGIYGGIRIGFNPAELLDLLLGFTTYDLLNDDVEPEEPAAEEKPETKETPAEEETKTAP